MARIAGVDLPKNKRIEIALTYIYGLGLSSSQKILEKANAIKFLHTNVFYVKARDLSELWSSQISKDSISILSNECKIIVKEKLNKLNRRFNIKDFER